jgi:hypothetical protein
MMLSPRAIVDRRNTTLGEMGIETPNDDDAVYKGSDISRYMVEDSVDIELARREKKQKILEKTRGMTEYQCDMKIDKLNTVQANKARRKLVDAKMMGSHEHLRDLVQLQMKVCLPSVAPGSLPLPGLAVSRIAERLEAMVKAMHAELGLTYKPDAVWQGVNIVDQMHAYVKHQAQCDERKITSSCFGGSRIKHKIIETDYVAARLGYSKLLDDYKRIASHSSSSPTIARRMQLDLETLLALRIVPQVWGGSTSGELVTPPPLSSRKHQYETSVTMPVSEPIFGPDVVSCRDESASSRISMPATVVPDTLGGAGKASARPSDGGGDDGGDIAPKQRRYMVFEVEWTASTPCPLRCLNTISEKKALAYDHPESPHYNGYKYGCRDWVVTNLETGERIVVQSLSLHLLAAHNFVPRSGANPIDLAKLVRVLY